MADSLPLGRISGDEAYRATWDGHASTHDAKDYRVRQLGKSCLIPINSSREE